MVNGMISVDEINPEMPVSEINKVFKLHGIDFPEKLMVPLFIQMYKHGGVILKGIGDNCEFTWKNIEIVLTEEEAQRLFAEMQHKEETTTIILPPSAGWNNN